MPELPEVETLRRGLEHHLVGQKITGVRVLVPKMVKGNVTDPGELARKLQGVATRISRTARQALDIYPG